MADVDEDGSLGSQEKVGWWAVAPNCPCRGTCFYLPHNISPSDRDLDHVTSLNHLKRNWVSVFFSNYETIISFFFDTETRHKCGALPLISQLPLLPDIFLLGRVRSNSPNSCEPSRSSAAELRSVFNKQIPMICRVFGWIGCRTLLVVVEQWETIPSCWGYIEVYTLQLYGDYNITFLLLLGT